ncbi:hypothetical protein ACIQVE_25200 [Pseudomonas sp. NPDC098747]|uniref:hypothetical protein n=1 Tax=Pseudomonas sp. NPDC098747 TaxID=3364487 RepID=UPI00383BCC94
MLIHQFAVLSLQVNVWDSAHTLFMFIHLIFPVSGALSQLVKRSADSLCASLALDEVARISRSESLGMYYHALGSSKI